MNEQDKRENEIKWQEIIARFKTSGLSGKKFSVQESISEAQLWYWNGRYKDKPPKSLDLTKDRKLKESNFIDLEPSINISPELEFKSSSQMLELTLPLGIVLKMWN